MNCPVTPPSCYTFDNFLRSPPLRRNQWPQQSSSPGFFSVIVVGLLVYVPMIVIVYRLSVVLPAAALEESLGIGGAWERTKGTTGTIIVLAIVSALGFIVIGLPVLFIFNPGSVPAIIWSFFTDWVAIMVGVSILTTLYGHYVEERPLV